MNKDYSGGKPYILLTNDDGVQSPGLHALASAVLPFADIEIIAPSDQMTATGRGLFGDRSLQLQTTSLQISGKSISAYHAACSPALVVYLGAQIFRENRKPDLLMSGINYGENMGYDVTMSGTVGAAMQAAAMGIPALAVSKQTNINTHYEHTEENWDAASYFGAKFAALILENQLPLDVDLIKVDIPEFATQDTPWRVTRQAKQNYFVRVIDSPTLESRLSDGRLTIPDDPKLLAHDTDIYTVLEDGLVSVTPMSLDSTARTDMEAFHQLLERGS